jgi:hypothetical protein
MARVIAFCVPANFKPAKPRATGPNKVVEFNGTNAKSVKTNSFWMALEKMLPDLNPQTQR